MYECICKSITTKDIEQYAEDHNLTYLDAFQALLDSKEEGCGRCDTLIANSEQQIEDQEDKEV